MGLAMFDAETMTAELGLFCRRVLASVITWGVAIAASLPLMLLLPYWWREILLLFIFATQLTGRCVGMYWAGLRWQHGVSSPLLYAALYTAGFATLLFWVVFPFDLLLINLLCLQLPCYLLTGTTAHAWLSGIRSERIGRQLI